jgi:rhamnosyltransferase
MSTEKVKASVIIPTKNPGGIFRRVLERTLEQETPWPFEVIVIDSGSTDGTVAFAQERPGVRVIEIAPETFGHGRTRNLAVGEARGDFVALLTHDALPVDRTWLRNLVGAVEQHPTIAGSFGRHIAYDHASPFTKRDLEKHFAGFLAHPLIVSRFDSPEKYQGDIGWRQFLHFFSDNNACLRRSVWLKIPYPDVEFAEDQIWASRVIDAGWSKAYAPDAAVYHSHDYDVFDRLRRAFDESLAFRRLFGYRLGGSVRQMVRSITGLCKADWRWGQANGIRISQRLHRIGEDAALVIGHSIGSRGDDLPGWVQRRLSRDKKLFHSLGPAGKTVAIPSPR